MAEAPLAPELSNSTDSGAAKEDDNSYECNICFETASDAVVSLCGHLYCWPCLHQWLETRPYKTVCPVCKAAIDRDKVIPVYNRGNYAQQDPRDKIPARPAGQRQEPEDTFPGIRFDRQFQLSFGFGAFPFGLFMSSENENRRPAGGVQVNNRQENGDDHVASRFFLFMAVIFLFWVIMT